MELLHTHQEGFLLFDGVEHRDAGHDVIGIMSSIQAPIQSRSVELAISAAFGQRSFLVHLNGVAFIVSGYFVDINPAAE
jgi:hypothetical protein